MDNKINVSFYRGQNKPQTIQSGGLYFSNDGRLLDGTSNKYIGENINQLRSLNTTFTTTGSISFGENNISGCRGLKIGRVELADEFLHVDTKATIYVSETGYGHEDGTIPTSWEIGDTLTIFYSVHYWKCCVIQQISDDRKYMEISGWYWDLIDDFNEGKLTNGILNDNHKMDGPIEISYMCSALGKNNFAYGRYALVSGNNNVAGYDCIVSGNNNKAIGFENALFGYDSNIEGSWSKGNLASGGKNLIKNCYRTTVLGYNNEVQYCNSSLIAGIGLKAKFDMSNALNSIGRVVLGQYNEAKNDNIFEFGCGTSNNDRRNCLSINSQGTVNGNFSGTFSGTINGTASGATLAETTKKIRIKLLNDYSNRLPLLLCGSTQPATDSYQETFTDGNYSLAYQSSTQTLYCGKLVSSGNIKEGSNFLNEKYSAKNHTHDLYNHQIKLNFTLNSRDNQMDTYIVSISFNKINKISNAYSNTNFFEFDLTGDSAAHVNPEVSIESDECLDIYNALVRIEFIPEAGNNESWIYDGFKLSIMQDVDDQYKYRIDLYDRGILSNPWGIDLHHGAIIGLSSDNPDHHSINTLNISDKVLGISL